MTISRSCFLRKLMSHGQKSKSPASLRRITREWATLVIHGLVTRSWGRTSSALPRFSRGLTVTSITTCTSHCSTQGSREKHTSTMCGFWRLITLLARIKQSRVGRWSAAFATPSMSSRACSTSGPHRPKTYRVSNLLLSLRTGRTLLSKKSRIGEISIGTGLRPMMFTLSGLRTWRRTHKLACLSYSSMFLGKLIFQALKSKRILTSLPWNLSLSCTSQDKERVTKPLVCTHPKWSSGSLILLVIWSHSLATKSRFQQVAKVHPLKTLTRI